MRYGFMVFILSCMLFENLKVELAMDPEKENNLITSEGENFELWLVKNFAS